MGAYLGQLISLFTPASRESDVRVESQSEIACCTSSTVIYDDSDEDGPWRKRDHK